MPLLAQQELLEAPPARRLVVPAGHAAHWGVDPGCQRVAVAYAENGPSGVARAARTASFAPLRGGQRLAAIFADTRSFVLDLLSDGWPLPGLVFVELPAGQPPNLELIYAAGVQQAAMFSAVQEWTGRNVAVETVPTASWKKAACGKGNIYKPKRGEGRESYGVLQWARAVGYAGRSFDECDALGIAEAARRSVTLEER